MKNPYCKRGRFSARKMRDIIRCFSLDMTATQTSNMTGVSMNTIDRYFRLFRERISEDCEQQSPYNGQVEVDESYFGARRVKGKRGRGARGKTIVFGIFKRNGHVYTEVVPDCKAKTLQAVIRGKVDIASIIHSDGWRGYNGLVDVGYKKHLRVDHGANEFVRGNSHINGIEGFWGVAKTRLAKFKGMHPSTFYLHLKECEFRYNHRQDDIYGMILKMLRKNPI